ncbi:ATP-binding protein [Krasilnikovia sp. M28-CT-15]|uniref:ATP-binding protein n=1 Tax=Krasilnikovia sp. M28-CT-15 TaxID=3373540 RepID=UPI00399CAF7B
MEERIGSCASQETLRPTAGRQDPAAGPAASPTSAGPVLLDRTFGRDDITAVRHEVTDRLTAAGIAGDRLHGFVLAVNEVITNVVLHAGGHGRIVVWVTAGSAWCTVTDSGPGIPERFLGRPGVPEAFEVGGRGIWLAHQLCDEVTIATGPIGTTIGLRIGLGPAHRP